jgi:aspartate/methionine/tyrosine aminotransferase
MESELVSERVNRIEVSPTMKVAAEAKKMMAEGLNVIDLSVGEPDFPTPRNISDAAIKAINENHTKYTVNAGTVPLRKAIAKKLKDDNGVDYAINEIIVSSGAKQSIFNAVHSVIYDGDEVIIPAPYWVSYPEIVKLAMGKPVFVSTKEENGFRLTAKDLEAAITPKTKLLILCNPSNPTGSAYNEKELLALAEVIADKDIWVLSDEIYEKLVYGGFKTKSFAALGEKIKQKTILINGVSKSYSMTGWRIGYTAAPEPVVKGIDKIQSHSTSNASSISQDATLEALTGPQDAVEMMRVEFEKRRDYFHKELTAIPGFTCYKPEGAFYLFPNVSGFIGKKNDKYTINNSMDFAMYLLYEAKIAAVPGSAFGAENYIRFSYATSMENLVDAIARLKDVLGKLK